MSNVIRFDLMSGTIKQDLAELPEKMLRAAFEALDMGAERMKQIAKNTVPVDTGTLRKSIRKERGGMGQYWRVVRVRAGGYHINPKSKRLCDYAGHVENRTPFLRPAFEQVRPYIRDLIRQRVVEAVQP